MKNWIELAKRIGAPVYKKLSNCPDLSSNGICGKTHYTLDGVTEETGDKFMGFMFSDNEDNLVCMAEVLEKYLDFIERLK